MTGATALFGVAEDFVYPRFKYSDYFIENDSIGLRIREYDSDDNFSYSANPDTSLRRSSTFFVKSTLKIAGIETNELTDSGRWGWRAYEVLRRFVEIKIKNTGNEPAVDCEVRLRLQEQIDGCRILSTEDKFLTWDTGKKKTTISAKYGEAKFYLGFSQKELPPEYLEKISPVFCGIKKQEIKFQSWLGTQEALGRPHERDQDGMCDGRFRVHVEVYTVTGSRVFTDFIISVGDKWQILDAQVSKCKCINHSLYAKIKNRFPRTKKP
jgi:hypothetical protein